GTDDPGEPDLPPPRPPDFDNPDSGSLGVGERARDASAPKSEGGAPFARAGAPAGDCPAVPGPGDLAIVEIMIESQSGPGDRGEWIEIQNTRNCTLNLRGLRVESPRTGDTPDAVDIDYDMSLGPNEVFTVADTLLDDDNHHLPSPVLSWIATDALNN